MIAFTDTVQALDGMKRLKQIDMEQIFTSLCSHCLPEKVRMAWEDDQEKTTTVAPVSELLAFVKRKADNPLYAEKGRGSSLQGGRSNQDRRPAPRIRGSAHVVVNTSPEAPPPQHTGQTHRSTSGGKTASYKGRGSTTRSSYICALCQEPHYPWTCSKFKAMTVAQRKAHVSNQNLCSLCLRPGHAPEACRGDFSCRLCKGGHNYMLHADAKPSQEGSTVSSSANVVVAQASGSLGSKKLLMTCQVMAIGPGGRTMAVRGLLDSGAGSQQLQHR